MVDASNAELSDCKGLTSAVGEIYAAVEDPTLWPAVLDQIAELVDGESTFLVANYSDSVAKDVRAFDRTDPAALVEYQLHYDVINVWTGPCDRMFGVGKVGYAHWAVPDAELKKSEFYAGWLKPNGLACAFGVAIPLPGQAPAFLTSFGSPLRKPFDETEGRVFASLLPHLQRAIRLHFELTILRSAKQGLELALDAFDRAVIGLSGHGKILFCNQTARLLLAEADGLRATQNHLVAEQPGQDKELQFLLTEAAVTGAGFSAAGAILIERKSARPALRLSLMPFAGNLLKQIPGLAILVFVDDPSKRPMSRAIALRKLFRLSPAETRLTELLAGGVELSAAAEQLRMSTQTARFHLKSIFRKTGLKRQVDLVRLLLSLPGEVPMA